MQIGPEITDLACALHGRHNFATDHKGAHVGATLPSGSDGQSFLWETVLTVFLMFVIMAVATDTRAVGEAAAIAVGGTVGLDALFGGPISGASMNPARSLGPALVSGNLHALWLYIVAPVIGTSVGGYLPGVHLESMLAVALTLRGAQVHLLLCDEFLPA